MKKPIDLNQRRASDANRNIKEASTLFENASLEESMVEAQKRPRIHTAMNKSRI
jgi:hypothetical protein